MKKNKLITNKQKSQNVRKHWQLTIGSQYFKLSYWRKNDALITLRNICHDETSTPNLTNNWLVCQAVPPPSHSGYNYPFLNVWRLAVSWWSNCVRCNVMTEAAAAASAAAAATTTTSTYTLSHIIQGVFCCLIHSTMIKMIDTDSCSKSHGIRPAQRLSKPSQIRFCRFLTFAMFLI